MEQLKGSPEAAFVIAAIVALLTTPLVLRLALRCQAVARPDARRTHEGVIPQWGGVSIFLGVLIAAIFWRQPTAADARLLAPSGSVADVLATQHTLHLSTAFMGCGLLMLLVGMADDRYELAPWAKFAAQAVIIALLWKAGVRIRTLPFTSGTHNLSTLASLGLTVVWVMALTNAINFIDGVDGLAAGVCAIAAGSLCCIEHLKGANWAAAAAAAVCGACLGFLRYNFVPARIFLGDAGALLLGFWLATITVAAAAKTLAATTLALPILVLGVPMVDIAWAVVRRTLAGQPFWRADRGHVHHRLLARGYSPRQTVYLIYAVSAALGAAAVVWVKVRG